MKQNSCDCCEGTEALTPGTIANRPGLDQLAYRVGTHATFLETMKARLSNLCLGDEAACQEGKGPYPLQSLTTREADDPAIAALDAWATVADVLTFYQERIANECYLGTAVERQSIQELARLVGYKLRPGVAASTYLAFTVEKDQEVEIPAGTRAQSLPGPGEKPQPFETAEPLSAKATWNIINPRLSQLQVMAETTHTVYLAGINTKLKPNDPLLIIDTSSEDNAQAYFRQIHRIEPDKANDRTEVFLKGDLNLTELEGSLSNIRRMIEIQSKEAGDQEIKAMVTSIVNLHVLPQMDNLKLQLKIPSLPINVLKREIRMREPLLAQAYEIFNNFEFTELAELIGADYEHGLRKSIKNIKEQLELRRGILDTPSRLYKNKYIESSIVYKILVHLKKLNTLLSPENVSSDDFIVNQFRMLYKEMMETIFPKLRDDTIDEDEKIMTIQEQTSRLVILSLLVSTNSDYGSFREWLDGKEPYYGSREWWLCLIFGQYGHFPWGSDPDYSPRIFDPVNPPDYYLSRTLPRFVSLRGGRELVLPGTMNIPGATNKFSVIPSSATQKCQDREPGLRELFWTITTTVQRATTLPKLIPPLMKPRTQPPANTLRLERTMENVFTPGGEVAPRLLTTLQRELQDTLYQAWENTEVASFSALPSPEVLRIKAAPYGAKVPLKPISDPNGAIVGYKEWPLLGISLLLLFERIRKTSNYSPSFRVQIVITRETGERFEMGAKLSSDQDQISLSLRGTTIEITRSQTEDVPPTLDKITIKVGKHEITLTGSRAATINFSNNNDDGYTLELNETWIKTIDDNLVTFTSKFNAEPSLLVDDLPIQLPDEQQKCLTLDAEYERISEGGWVVIEWPEATIRKNLGDANPNRLIRRIEKVDTLSKPNYGKVTQLRLNKAWLGNEDTSLSALRNAIIYAESEALPLAEEPINVDVQGNIIRLNGLYGGLESGRRLIIAGERTDIPGASGIKSSELAMIASVKHTIQQIEVDGQLVDLRGDRINTTIELANQLTYSYKCDTVQIYANVVKATHGETQQEVLGSGDGRLSRQSFTLQKFPLTYLASATPTGAENTLEIRVNDVLWHEADNMIWLGDHDRDYITHTDQEDKTSIIFGDGQHGARLPTGVENIKAVYRTGLGKTGNVVAEQISQLAKRPLGVKGVVNPLAATGGANREDRDQARRNAPLAVMALDRLVSVQDYADFAQAYAGIDKASAVRLSDARQEIIHLTIAGVDDIPIGEDSDLYRGLCQALYRFGDPRWPVKVASRELMLLVMSVNVCLHPDYQWESVAPKIRATLLDALSFDRRQLGQDALLSEALSLIQLVPGVVYADIDVFDSIEENIPLEEMDKLAGADVLTLKERIEVQMGRTQTTHVVKRSIETLSSIARRYQISEVTLWELNTSITNPDELAVGTTLSIPHRKIRPAQLAYLSPDVPDTLILKEVSS